MAASLGCPHSCLQCDVTDRVASLSGPLHLTGTLSLLHLVNCRCATSTWSVDTWVVSTGGPQWGATHQPDSDGESTLRGARWPPRAAVLQRRRPPSLASSPV